MQDGPQQELEHLISEGQRQLERYHESKEVLKNPNADLNDSFWSEVAGAVVGDLFESGRIGSEVRKLSRSSMKANRKTKMKQLDNRLAQQAASWISHVSNFLGLISTASSSTPNSKKLLSKFSRVE